MSPYFVDMETRVNNLEHRFFARRVYISASLFSVSMHSWARDHCSRLGVYHEFVCCFILSSAQLLLTFATFGKRNAIARVWISVDRPDVAKGVVLVGPPPKTAFSTRLMFENSTQLAR